MSTRLQSILVLVALALATALSLHGLGNHKFWDDEANTAIFGRNLLHTGRLTAWDGRNLIAFNHGAELDEHLINVYMPPMQYWTAAVGLAAFGESTVGARLPFVISGLAALPVLALWAHRFVGGGFPVFLPPLLLALAPSYLLYIRNCRYYALGVLFTLIALACFSSDLRTRARFFASVAVLFLSVLGLWLSQYLNAASLVMGLPLLFAFERYRTRRHLAAFAAACVASLIACLWIYLTANPLAADAGRPDPAPWLVKTVTLLAWHVKGLGTFEFVPVLLVPLLAIPFFHAKSCSLRWLAERGLVVAGLILISCLVTAALSPQAVSGRTIGWADMRQQVPAIALGSLVAGIALYILWHALPKLAVATALILVLSNALHLGFLAETAPGFEARGLSCTLCRYVSENFNDYTTGTEALVGFLRKLPEGTRVLIRPEYMTYAPMFYAPHLRYAQALPSSKPLSPSVARELPDYLFSDRAEVDVAIFRAPRRPTAPQEWRARKRNRSKLPVGVYRSSAFIASYPYDRSRAELPWHSFSPAEFAGFSEQGFIVFDVTQETPPDSGEPRVRKTSD